MNFCRANRWKPRKETVASRCRPYFFHFANWPCCMAGSLFGQCCIQKDDCSGWTLKVCSKGSGRSFVLRSPKPLTWNINSLAVVLLIFTYVYWIFWFSVQGEFSQRERFVEIGSPFRGACLVETAPTWKLWRSWTYGGCIPRKRQGYRAGPWTEIWTHQGTARDS